MENKQFKFEIDSIGEEVDENGNVELMLRHDDRFVEYVQESLNIDEFDESKIKEFLLQVINEYSVAMEYLK